MFVLLQGTHEWYLFQLIQISAVIDRVLMSSHSVAGEKAGEPPSLPNRQLDFARRERNLGGVTWAHSPMLR